MVSYTLLQKLETPLPKHGIGAVIISPTRELAAQIFDVVSQFLGRFEALTSMLLIGGRTVQDDLKAFEENGAHVVVATPGRLDDILTGKSAGSVNSQQQGGRFRMGLKSLVSTAVGAVLSFNVFNEFNG